MLLIANFFYLRKKTIFIGGDKRPTNFHMFLYFVQELKYIFCRMPSLLCTLLFAAFMVNIFNFNNKLPTFSTNFCGANIFSYFFKTIHLMVRALLTSVDGKRLSRLSRIIVMCEPSETINKPLIMCGSFR